MASERPFVNFYIPDEGYGSILQCPTCTETSLHHIKVEVKPRAEQDVGDQNVAVVHAANQCDDAYMTFECETCDWRQQTLDQLKAHVPMTTRPYRLRIRQHRGSTVFTWVPASQ